ncbi:MAG: hypothetical protein ABIQ33_11745 [Caldimonas sp.]
MSTGVTEAGFLSSLALVGLLGFRHGFDADHIAAIDGMTRARQLHGSYSYWAARLVGGQFALGHSVVILIASLLLHGQRATLPPWLDGLGLAISTSFLLAIAASNLAHAWRPRADRPVGPMSAALLRLTGRQLHPALVGMAFALSFDAIAQAGYFAVRGGEFGGLGAIFALAAMFGLGMLVADAGNGLLFNAFASRSDRLARRASRFSSGFIALLALLTAAVGVGRAAEAGFEAAWEGLGIWAGVGLVGCTVVVYSVRLWMQRPRPGRVAAG